MHRMTQHQWTLSQVQQISGHTFLVFQSGVALMSKVWKEKSILFFSWLRTNNIFQKPFNNYYFLKIIIFVFANKNINFFFIIAIIMTCICYRSKLLYSGYNCLTRVDSQLSLSPSPNSCEYQNIKRGYPSPVKIAVWNFSSQKKHLKKYTKSCCPCLWMHSF